MTNNLLIEEGGSIHSDYYNSDGSVNNDSGAKSGVYMDSSGNLKAENAEFTNTSVSGKFSSDSLETFEGKPDIDSNWGLGQSIESESKEVVDNTQQLDTTIGDNRYDDYEELSGINYANGIYVLTGDNGCYSYSYDGVNWATPQEMDSISCSYTVQLYGSGKFIYFYNASTVYISSNGTSWSTQSVSFDSFITSGTVVNEVFTVVSYLGTVYRSSNGTTWTEISSKINNPESNNKLPTLVYKNNLYLLQSKELFYKSSDAITWTTIPIPSEYDIIISYRIQTITYENGLYFLLGGTNGIIYTSTDLETWTSHLVKFSDTTSTSIVWSHLIYNEGKYMLISYKYISYSSDGLTWTDAEQFSSLGNRTNEAVVLNGKVFILGQEGVITNSTTHYTIDSICSYLSTLLDDLIAPSGETLPETEPLLYFSGASGTVTADGTTYNLSSLKCKSSYISFVDDTSITHTYQSNADLLNNFKIEDLIIKGESEENAITSVVPKNGNGTGSIGKDGQYFAEGFINDLTLATPNTFSSGYVIMPNGLIIQWGSYWVNDNTKKTYNFKITFSTTPSLTTGSDWQDYGGWAPAGGYAISPSRFNLWSTYSRRMVWWIAVGY